MPGRSTLNIGVNARTLSAETPRGWSRYTSNLFRKLSHKKDVHLYLFSDRELNPELIEGFCRDRLNVVIKKGFSYIHWEQWVLPRLCQRLGIDALHCPIHYGLPFLGSFQKILTLHDAIEVSYVDAQLRWWEKLNWRRLYARSLNAMSRRVAHSIVTVSEFSKMDLLRFYELPLGRIQVIGEGVDPLFQPDNTLGEKVFRKQFNLNRPYFFYIGGLEGRKNIEFLLQSFMALNNPSFDLVLAGGSSEDADHFGKMVQKKGWSDNIIFLGSVEEHFLPSLYAYAQCFIYPSLYEGFGLQLLEAFHMNCPVLVKKMSMIIAEPQLSKDINDFGQKRRKDFTWDKAADQTLKLYKKLIRS